MLNAIDPKSAIPIYAQVMEQIRQRIAAGVLAPGDQLPSVRELASHLLINPNTVARIYHDLEHEGLIETRRGQGTFVAAAAVALAEADRVRLVARRLEEIVAQARTFGLSDEALVRLLQDALGRAPRPAEKVET